MSMSISNHHKLTETLLVALGGKAIHPEGIPGARALEFRFD